MVNYAHSQFERKTMSYLVVECAKCPTILFEGNVPECFVQAPSVLCFDCGMDYAMEGAE